jgi:DNA repair protein RadC
MTKQTPHYHGHRERLRRRVLDKGVESLTDLEVLEYLLFSARPRGDTKPLVKTLIKCFGNLAGVLNASREELATIAGLGEASIAALKIVPEAARRLALEEASERPVIAFLG